MTFDQYSRYHACSEIISRISEDGDIIDIGSGNDCLLGRFLKDRDITYVDPLLTQEDNGNNKIKKGSIFDIGFENQKFDYVCSIDMLEHIQESKRSDFIKRISTMAGKGIVLGFPTSDDNVALNVDKVIKNVFRKEYGREYPWIEEHFRYGLPRKKDVVEQLENLGWNVILIGHGHAPWIRLLLSIIISGWEIPETHSAIGMYSKQFDDELYQYDFNPPFYRWFVIALKDDLSKYPLKFGIPIDQSANDSFNNIVVETFSSIFSAILNSGESIGAKFVDTNDKLNKMAYWAKGLEIRLEEADKNSIEFNKKIDLMNELNGALQYKLEKTKRIYHETDADLNETKQKVDKLSVDIENANIEIQKTKMQLEEYKSNPAQIKMQEIISSKEWMLAIALRNIRYKLFPNGSIQEALMNKIYNYLLFCYKKSKGSTFILQKVMNFYSRNGAQKTLVEIKNRIKSKNKYGKNFEAIKKDFPEIFNNFAHNTKNNKKMLEVLERSGEKALKHSFDLLDIEGQPKRFLDAVKDYYGRDKYYLLIHDLLIFEREVTNAEKRIEYPLIKASELDGDIQIHRRKKILFITSLFPNIYHGGGNRVVNYIKVLSEIHDVYLFTPYNKNEDEYSYKLIAPFCESIRTISYGEFGGNQDEILKWLDGRYMDIVHYEWPPSIENYSHKFGRYHIFTYMEAVSLRLLMDMKLHNPMSAAWVDKCALLINSMRIEIAQTIGIDARIAVTTKDAEFFKKIYPYQEYTILNHGVSFEEYSLKDAEPEKNCLVFVGNYVHYPNADAMKYFFKEIWDRIRTEIPDVKIYIVGANPPSDLIRIADDKQIIVTGKVPDVRPYIQKGSVCIAPLVTGAGLRGKVLEYAALKRTFVATSIATTDLLLKDGEDYLLADNAIDFSNCVIKLLKEKEKREKMAISAYETARLNYDTRRLATYLEKIYMRLEKRAIEEN